MDWLTLAEAADLCGCSRMTIHRAAETGDLPYASCPLGRLFATADVLEWRVRREGDAVAEGTVEQEATT